MSISKKDKYQANGLPSRQPAHGAKPSRASLTIVMLSFLLLSAACRGQEPNLPTAVTDIQPTVVSIDSYYDPFESVNRRIFGFNDFVYRRALIPISDGYQKVVPAPARTSLLAAFRNIQEPFNAIFHSAQGEFAPAGRNILRFAINSTVGLLGLFDPATAWMEIEPDPSSLNETLMVHGVGQGPFIVLPLFGSADLRSGLSRFTESYFHPVSYLTTNPETSALVSFDAFQLYAPAASSYISLTEESDDPYLYLRNQYLQGVARDQDAIDDR